MRRVSSIETSELRLFADDVVLLVSPDCDLQHTLERFAELAPLSL